MISWQQPAGEVASTLLVPKDYYQKTSGLRSISQSLNTILTPVAATSLFALAGIEAVIAVDLITFAAAFLTLLLFISIPEPEGGGQPGEKLLDSARSGLVFCGNCRKNRELRQIILVVFTELPEF